MKLSILAAGRHVSVLRVAGQATVINIDTECELLVLHSATIIYREKRCWRVIVPNPLFEAMWEYSTPHAAMQQALHAIRWNHRHYCTGCFQPDISKRRPEMQELARLFVHPTDRCGYCERGEPHVHTDRY